MRIRRLSTIAGVPRPPGPFSWSAAYGGLVFLAGIRGIDPATGRPAAGDERRIALIFAHFARVLTANGCSPVDVLSTRVFVTDMDRHRPLVNAAFARFFGPALPVRTIVEVRALNQGDTIEMEAIAVRRRRSSRPVRRRAAH